MIYIVNIILIAISLSMDAFALAFSYGIKKINFKNIIITAITVGVFHFFMPLIGNIFGISLFEYTIIKPRYLLFIIFLIISIDMFFQFFEKNTNLRNLNIIGIFIFAISVSIDSFTVGLGINYIYDNILVVVGTFCVISMIFTVLGFYLGEKLSSKIGKYAFLLGSIILLIYSIFLLTN